MAATTNEMAKKPRVILGTMTFGPDPSTGARITSLDTYNEILDHFQSQGYSEIDTARCYVGGQQEAFTRAARWKERGLKLATKWYPYNAGDETHGAHKAERVEKELNTSLSELGTDSVDIFYLHRADRTTPFQEPLRKCNEMYKQGKFKQLGLSNYAAFEVAEIVMLCKANEWVQPTIYQVMYNAISRSIESELISACRRYGLDIVVYNPIAGGLFSSKYSIETIPTEGRFSNVDGLVGDTYRKKYFNDANFKALEIVEPVAKKYGLTLLEVAFRWLRHHSKLNMEGNDGIVIGMSSLKQLEQNLKDLEKGALPQEVVEALDRAWLVTMPTSAGYVHGELEYEYDTRKALRSLS
ncbi:Aflatoxin B1 aldehyde reductase member 2 [Pseudocercospora fuligena]|uniref:Aflatoxin B1 aldehyde reductase member 2 n=1 Tax=Pseudocercospora fuligena TaxID=685502 RepID=A0A8H6RL21_9PEZI|nr:Aflatoxin B1 aldehyde reductase member 2 [Pseudocercospora fuligena]